MESINFNNTADTENITVDSIIEALEQLKVSMNRIKKIYTDFYESFDWPMYFKNIKEQLHNINLDDDTKLILQNIFDILNKTVNENQSNTELSTPICFTDEQIQNFENVNVNINNYCIVEKSTKYKKFFNIDKFISFSVALVNIFLKNLTSNTDESQNKIIQNSYTTNITIYQEVDSSPSNNSPSEIKDIIESVYEQLKSSPDEC